MSPNSFRTPWCFWFEGLKDHDHYCPLMAYMANTKTFGKMMGGLFCSSVKRRLMKVTALFGGKYFRTVFHYYLDCSRIFQDLYSQASAEPVYCSYSKS